MRQGLYYCRFPDSVVILDPISDRYRLLKGEGADRFNRTIEGRVSQADQDWFAKQQIDFSNCNQPDPIAAPSASALDTLSGHGKSLFTIQAAWHQLRYQRRLRSHPLHLILGSLAAKRSRRSKSDQQRTWQIAAGSSRAKHFVSAQDQCLPRALAMAHMLFREGIGAQLVFGVTMPFAAHCWVQQGDVVLSDPLDRVLPFRPIMVL